MYSVLEYEDLLKNLNNMETLENIDRKIDHIRPVSRGGSDSVNNLQALNTSVNRSKGASLIKRSRHNQY